MLFNFTPWMSKNMMNICFFVERLTLNFFGDGDPRVFHIVDCSFDSGSYRLIHVSSAVTILLRKSSTSRSNR